MNTTIRGGAIRRLPQTTGYADGGSVSPWSLKGIANSVKGALTKTPDQIQKEADLAEYRKNSAAEREASKFGTRTTPTNAIASYVANTALQEREKSAGLKNGGAIKGPRGAIRGMAKMHPDVESKAEDMREPKNAERMEMRGMKCGGAIKKMANGGKLQGPGTPTSDSIPAEVVDTGEPIKVATGERIVSKKQDAFLLDQAKTAGFKNIDSWLEAGTGHPVGPTIHYQKGAIRKMASGGLIEDEKAQTGGATGSWDAPKSPTPGDGQMSYGDQMSNLGSALVNAPVSAIKTLVSAPGYGVNRPTPAASTPEVQASAPVPAAAPVTKPATAPVAAPAPTVADAQTGLGALPKSPSIDPMAAKAERDAQTQKDIALGNQMETSRKASEAAGYAAQDRGIDASLAVAAKVDAERARWNAESKLSSRMTSPEEKQAAMQTLGALNAQQASDQNNTALAQRNNVNNATIQRGQDQTATNFGAIQKLARDRLGIEQSQESRAAASSTFDQKAKQQLFDAQQEYLNAGDDPVKLKAAERKLITLGGKQAHGDQYAYAPGGQMIDPATGQAVTQAGVIFNKSTGQTVQQATQPKTQPHPDGTQLRGKDGKTYVVKNGIPVPL